MVASVSYIENQPSLADDFLNSINSIFKKFFITKNKISEKEINKYFFRCVQRVHSLNANAETVRDFIEYYHINDIVEDEKILSQFTNTLIDLIDAVDDTILEIEKLKIDTNIKTTLLNSFEELASTITNTNFSISQKIAKAYIDSKSNFTILKDA